MRFTPSILTSLLKSIDRRQFATIVERRKGDAYDKSFSSWDHMVALIYAQLSHTSGLRALVTSFNANRNRHYHLGADELARSTLSDANARRPPEVFADVFAMLADKADRQTRRDGAEMIRLIDSSPVPLGKICDWAKWNGRIRGMKMHVVYDPKADVPRSVEITQATVNDVEIGRKTTIEARATYVFDKGYCRFDWWVNINECKAFFVTRLKANTRLRRTKVRYVRKSIGDGFRILDDAEVKLASKGDSKLAIPLRRIRIKRDTGQAITLITNDLERTAIEIASLYKARWQIELLFRWIKQHLNIRKFLGTNPNAIRLQVIAAMIAYLLLRLAARLNHVKMPALRFAELIGQFLFSKRTIANIDVPPPVNPSRRKITTSPDQLELCYA
ncbi:MAG TPA: IS4 family transposase [Nordella sp.]|nr:IS4 family transposase [Nordella sp.]